MVLESVVLGWKPAEFEVKALKPGAGQKWGYYSIKHILKCIRNFGRLVDGAREGVTVLHSLEIDAVYQGELGGENMNQWS